MFVQRAGGAALAIPFLPSLLPRRAGASVPPSAKYVHINSSWGLPRAQTYPLFYKPNPAYPQPAGTRPDVVPWIQKDEDTSFQSLQAIVDFQGKLSWTLDEQWNPFIKRMNVITNAHAYVANNKFNASVPSTASSGPGTTGYGNANGPSTGHAYSVDWLIEQALGRSPPDARLRTLRIHPWDRKLEKCDCYLGFCWRTVNGVEMKIPMMHTIAETEAAVAGIGPADNSASSMRRKARIDSVLEDFQSLMNHRRIGALDRRRLSDAADLWRAVETRMEGAARSCGLPGLDDQTTNWRLIHQMAFDAIAAAMSCGVTRNVAYGLIHGGDTIQEIPGVSDSRVNGEANPSITDPYYGTVRWRSNLVTYFLSRLASLTDETGNSLLNSCLAVWAHTTASGNHGMLGHTLIVAGGANGKLDLGWHVDAGAAPVNRFHLTNMMAMGLALSDIEKGGQVGFGEYSPTTVLAAGGIETSERDGTRTFDVSKREHFFQDVERRRPFPYLKA